MNKLPLIVAVSSLTAVMSCSTYAAAASEWTLVRWEGYDDSYWDPRTYYLYGDGVWDGYGGVLTFSEDGFGNLTADAETVSASAYPPPYDTGLMLLKVYMTNWTISQAGVSTGIYHCEDGEYGQLYEVSACGKYGWGDRESNQLNESSYDSATGVTTIGGDDVAFGGHLGGNLYQGHSIADLEFTHSFTFVEGTNLYKSYSSRNLGESGLTGEGYTLTFLSSTPATVPVPAAAYLFGSALLGLVGLSRKR